MNDATEESRFSALTDPHRREIQAHCYRMMGSLQDAEDLCQETMLKAWRAFDRFDGRAPRAWLYRIATNVCLDALRERPRRMLPIEARPAFDPSAPLDPPVLEPIWLEPYPDALIPDESPGPEALVSLRESVALAFLCALQRLPPRQRAVLVLRDVAGWSASDTAAALGDSVASVNSALQRARETMERETFERESEGHVRTHETPAVESLIKKLIHAWESADVNALVALLREDVIFHMPPFPAWFRGRRDVATGLGKNLLFGDAAGRFRFLPAAANGQPTIAAYMADESGKHRAFALMVLTIDGDAIAQVAMFNDVSLFDRFALPPELPAELPPEL